MMAETEVPHPFYMIEVLHPSQTKALTTTQVTLWMATEASSMDDMEVTALTLAEPYIHTDEGFPRGSIDYYVLIGYVDHVAFSL